jgi:hypothetical protein
VRSPGAGARIPVIGEGASSMASGTTRRWTTWTARFAALLVAVVIPACGGSVGGARTNSALLWQSQAAAGGNVGAPSFQRLWVDPNSGLGGGTIGIIQIIASTDDVTYARFNASTKPPPFNLYVAYIFALEHPLSTDTGSITITSRESELLGHINGYRNMVMGNQAGGGGGAIIVGGGSVVLPSFGKGTKCARAHCKHYAYLHAGLPLPGEQGWNPHPFVPGSNLFNGAPWILQGRTARTSPVTNAEGDHVIFTLAGSQADQTNNPGMLTPLRTGMVAYNKYANQGRLGKIGVTIAPVAGEFSYSGLQWDDSLKVKDQILQDDAGLVVDFYPPPLYPVWSHICVGYWQGGANSFYWNILFIKNPNPAT